jgi:CheY-like chemotaxis protein
MLVDDLGATPTHKEDRKVIELPEMDCGSMNGFELAQQARERWPRIGIVVMSGRAAPAHGDVPERAMFMAKPYQPAAICGPRGQDLRLKHPHIDAIQRICAIR